MRYLESLQFNFILLKREKRRKTTEKNSQTWYKFALEIKRLDFKSLNIVDLLFKNSDWITARAALLHARNSKAFQYNEKEFELLINQMMTLFSKARKIDWIEKTFSLLYNDCEKNIKRRCERLFRKAQKEIV